MPLTPEPLTSLAPYLAPIAQVVSIIGTLGGLFILLRRKITEAVHRRWTEEKIAILKATGPRFRLQVLREDRHHLNWAVAHGHLSITKTKPWGWYVALQTLPMLDSAHAPH